MVPVARRNLLADKVRLLISVGGVTFAVLLILVVQSLYQGYSGRVGSFAESAPGELWILEANTNGFAYSSLIPAEREAQIAAVDGVNRTLRLYGKRMLFTDGAVSNDAYFLAFDVPGSLAQLPTPGTTIVDRVLAKESGLQPGDTIAIGGHPLTIARVEDLSGAGLSQFALVSIDDARGLFVYPEYVNYLLVSVDSGIDPATVASGIEDTVPGVRAVLKNEFAAANRSEVSKTFLPIVRVLLAVSFIVGAAVVGLTIYTATIERTREYGVLKALGATGRDLFRIVLTQSSAIGIAGFLLGVPLAFAVNRLASERVPAFITHIRWTDVGLVFVAALGMSALAAVIPLRRVVRIDPASVFRA